MAEHTGSTMQRLRDLAEAQRKMRGAPGLPDDSRDGPVRPQREDGAGPLAERRKRGPFRGPSRIAAAARHADAPPAPVAGAGTRETERASGAEVGEPAANAATPAPSDTHGALPVPPSGRTPRGMSGITAARLAAIPEIRKGDVPWAQEDKTRPPLPPKTMDHAPVTPVEVKTLGGPAAGAHLQELVYEPPQPGVQADGRYIPYSGGSLGWFENRGVSAIELRNSYQFFTAVDADWVRVTMLNRSGRMINKRLTDRHGLDPETTVTLIVGTQPQAAECTNFSASGMRVQIIAEQLAVHKGGPMQVQIHGKEHRNLLLDLTGSVVWVEKTGRTRTIWAVGIAFPELTPDQASMAGELTVERR